MRPYVRSPMETLILWVLALVITTTSAQDVDYPQAPSQQVLTNEEKQEICRAASAKLGPAFWANVDTLTPCETEALRDLDEQNHHHSENAYYDSFGSPISEDEYHHQVDYEELTGLPYHRNLTRELERLSLPLSITIYADNNCGHHTTQPAKTQQVHERDVCQHDVGGSSIYLESIPSNCDLVTFLDAECREDAYTLIDGIFDPERGCFSTDEFGSVMVNCGKLPE